MDDDMRPTFFGFETAKRGMMINQKGLDVTGHNMSNIGTKGYTRQRLDLVSLNFSSSSNRYPVRASTFAGMGTDIVGVAQIRDPFLDKRFREEYSDFGYYDQSTAIISDIENALDEVGGKGLQNSLSAVMKSLSDWSSEPDKATHANIVLTSTKNMVMSLNQYAAKLDNVSAQQRFDLGVSVDDLNSVLVRIANINESIGKEIFHNTEYKSGAYGPNELLDQRNALLDELSRYGSITCYPQKDGTVTVEMNGHKVIEGERYDQVNISDAQNGTSSLVWQTTGKEMRTDSGSLRAYMDMINGRGTSATGQNQNFSKGVPYYKDRLNAIAGALVEAFNGSVPSCDGVNPIDPATGLPGTGPHVAHPGKDFKQLLTGDMSGNLTAGNLRVTQDWLDDPSFAIPPTCVTNGEKNNAHILELRDRLTRDTDFGDFKGGVSDYINFYNGTIGQEAKYFQDRTKTSGAVADDLLNKRDGTSAVSLDEEGASLMLYDKAYKALSRVMTTMDEALDVLINRTGLVGR